MFADTLLWLTLGVFVIAFLYSIVGHAGASGYIAVMSLLSMAPVVIKPTALLLNILVASIAAFQFWRAGHFSWRLFWPFAVLAVPCAFMGGYINLNTQVFKILLGVVLIYSAWRFFQPPMAEHSTQAPKPTVALGVGAGLGFMAGLTGTGGGIFLTPLLLLMRWAPVKQAATVSALFILVNSIAGLAGNWASTRSLPSFAWMLLLAAGLGGLFGSYLGSWRFNHILIKRFLAAVLLIAGLKLLLS